MPGRSGNSDAYNRGFQGQVKTYEISGLGNHYTAEYWEMDPRLGRRWNLDPKFLAVESRYSSFSNNPIMYVDLLGDFRTKFGANVYKFFHGGEVGKNDKGQWYVNKSSVENGLVIIRPWVYDSKLSSIAEYGRGALGAIDDFLKFALGRGGNLTYKEGDFEADEMASSIGVKKALEDFRNTSPTIGSSKDFSLKFSPNPKDVINKTLEIGNPLNGFSQENKALTQTFLMTNLGLNCMLVDIQVQ